MVAFKHFFKIPYNRDNKIKERFEKKIINGCSLHNSKDEVNYDYRGYEKNSCLGNLVPVKVRTKGHLRENRRNPNQLKWLIKLDQLIHEDNRKLYVVMPPCRKDYVDLLPSKYELYNSIYKMNEMNFEILDFYDSELFTIEDFRDTDHLNNRGAEKLTSELMKIIKEEI